VRLKHWSRSLFSNTKLQLHMALHVILQLDLAMERRQLSRRSVTFAQGLKEG
jgi:hypothetical protein